MKSMHLVDNTIARLNVVCAYSEEQKRQAYQLRFKQIKEQFPSVTRLEQVIDQFDRDSTHILLQDNQSGKSIAAVRVSNPVSDLASHSTLPCQIADTHSLNFINQVFASGKALAISEVSRLSISPEYCLDESHKRELSEAMYLAAFSLARLRFDDRVLLSLPCKDFKRLRARGLQLEQTTTSLGEDKEELFWLSCESGIQENSLVYDSYQHILGCLTHQVNQPMLENDEYQLRESG